MAAERVTRTLTTNSTFARAVKKAGAAKMQARLDAVARSAEAAFDDIVRHEFVNDRSPDRRRTGRHLLGSSQATVVGTEFPLQIVIKSVAEGKKVGALNSGSPPHTITGNPWLVFPAGTKAAAGASAVVPSAQALRSTGGKAAFSSGYGQFRKGSAKTANRGRTVRTHSVQHPGTAGHFFLQRALERAVQEAFGKSVRLRRR